MKIFKFILSIGLFVVLAQSTVVLNNYEKSIYSRHDELKTAMVPYMELINKYFNSNKDLYLSKRSKNEDKSIVEESRIVCENLIRLENLEKSIAEMKDKPMSTKLYVLLKYPDFKTLKYVLDNYKPELYFSFEYLEFYALVLVLSFVLINILFLFFRLFFKKKKNKVVKKVINEEKKNEKEPV